MMKRDFYRTSTLDEALELYSKNPETVRFLSGGTEVLRKDSGYEGSDLVYILPLLDRSIQREGKSLIIGGGAVLQDIIDHPLSSEALKNGCRNAASRTLRCMATAAGNIAARRDDSYLIPLLAAYNAEILLMGHGKRTITLAMTSYLQDISNLHGTVITKIIIPDADLPVLQKRFSRSSQGKAAVTAAVSLGNELKVFASAYRTGLVRLHKVEEAAADHGNEQQIIQAVQACFFPEDDISGTSSYKQYLAGTAVSMFLQELRRNGG